MPAKMYYDKDTDPNALLFRIGARMRSRLRATRGLIEVALRSVGGRLFTPPAYTGI